MADEINIYIRLKLKRLTETDSIGTYTHLVPVSLERAAMTGDADADELYDASESIAETDDWLETLTNGSLDLIHSEEPHVFRQFGV